MRGEKKEPAKGLVSIIPPQKHRSEICALTHHTEVHKLAQSDCSYG